MSRDPAALAHLIEQSDALHEAVRSAVRQPTWSTPEFDALALRIAQFQARWSPSFARLIAGRGSSLATVDDIPAVPADAFRFTRVAVHPEALDSVRFRTSGTTTETPGVHVMRTTHTYRALAVRYGRSALGLTEGGQLIVALAPPPESPPTSSLGFMMQAFMEEFDAEPSDDVERWLFSHEGVRRFELTRAGRLALERERPLVVLATSFALVALLDELRGDVIACPAESIVMMTGGFKGRSRELDPAELRSAVARAFGIDPSRIIGEYGMTELSSQLYERTRLGASPGLYFPPPWLRVTPVDPVELSPVGEGEPGLARFVDLGNVDSAVAIVTQDLIRQQGDAIELLGRRRGAPARGCSLAIELLLDPNTARA